MKKRDLVFLIATILIVLIIFIVSIAFKNEANYAYVYSHDKIILEIDLNKDFIYEVEGDISKIKIEVKDKKVGIIENECPDKTCINMGFINSKSKSIICIPNGIVIKVDKQSGVDIEV